MANDKASNISDDASDIAQSAKEAADSALDAGKRIYERAEEKIDELSRFGSERPLMAMAIAFGLGYLTAKLLK